MRDTRNLARDKTQSERDNERETEQEKRDKLKKHFIKKIYSNDSLSLFQL